MLKHCLIATGLLLALGCDKRNDRDDAPTAAQREALKGAEADRQRAATEKERADQALAAAKQRQEAAETHLEKADDWAENVAGDVDVDRDRDRDDDGDDDGWSRDWATFASGSERSKDHGEYRLERDDDGGIASFRRTQRVSTRDDVSDADLSRAVEQKLGIEDDLRDLRIDVSADEGVVRLRGDVKSADQAGEAVRHALDVPGVDRVVSHLRFRADK